MSWKCKEEGQRPAYSYQSNKISSCVAQFLRKYCFSFSTLTSTLKVDQGRWNYYKRHNRSMQGTITQKIKIMLKLTPLKMRKTCSVSDSMPTLTFHHRQPVRVSQFTAIKEVIIFTPSCHSDIYTSEKQQLPSDWLYRCKNAITSWRSTYLYYRI